MEQRRAMKMTTPMNQIAIGNKFGIVKTFEGRGEDTLKFWFEVHFFPHAVTLSVENYRKVQIRDISFFIGFPQKE
jgi:hypothetical protein